MKLASLEPACEDYGQAVIYKGTIPGFESAWSLDDHHYMESGKVFPVCGNSYNMLKHTRFASHFEFIGDFSKHYGIFEGCKLFYYYDHLSISVCSFSR
jgi:arsenite methyltransferase